MGFLNEPVKLCGLGPSAEALPHGAVRPGSVCYNCDDARRLLAVRLAAHKTEPEDSTEGQAND